MLIFVHAGCKRSLAILQPSTRGTAHFLAPSGFNVLQTLRCDLGYYRKRLSPELVSRSWHLQTLSRDLICFYSDRQGGILIHNEPASNALSRFDLFLPPKFAPHMKPSLITSFARGPILDNSITPTKKFINSLFLLRLRSHSSERRYTFSTQLKLSIQRNPRLFISLYEITS